jgi:hypothetical protein
MRQLLLCGWLAFASWSLLRAQVPPPAPAPVAPSTAPSFSFDGQTFTRVSSTPTKTGFMEEYLPAGQPLSGWTAMASIHHLITAVADPVAATRGVADAVRQRNPSAQVVLMNDAATGDSMIDFVTWPPTATGNPPYLEYDICKYRKAPDGGLIALQYVRRAYGPQEQPFVQGIKAERQRLVPLMAAAQFNPQ